MPYDDRSIKPMSASLMRAQIAAQVVAGLYEAVPTMMTSSVRLAVELPGDSRQAGPPYPFTFAVSPAWCSGIAGARLVGSGKLDIAWLNPSVIAAMAYRGKGPFRRSYPLRALERIREEIPYDSAQVPPMSSFCRSTEEGPLDIPLHPGAERYYRERDYL